MPRVYQESRPLFQDSSEKNAATNSIRRDVPITIPPKRETINNTVELTISPLNELTKFTRKLIVLLMSLQTLVLLTVIVILYTKVALLESEAAKLSQLDVLRQQQLLSLSDQINAVKDECENFFTMDCSLFNDINSTGAADGELLLDLQIADEEDDGPTDESEETEEMSKRNRERIKRGVNRETRKPSKLQQLMGQVQRLERRRLKKMQKKRLVCQRCKTASKDDFSTTDKPKRHNNVIHPTPSPDASAVHFVGGLPEVMIQERGTIGPWFGDNKATQMNNSLDIKLSEPNKMHVSVLSDGIYFIYAQVYYLSKGGPNSFSIIKHEQLSGADKTMATCSSGSKTGTKETTNQEISCFTATVGHLTRGDHLYLTERQKNRRLLFREGQTFFGLMKIAPSPAEYKPVLSNSVVQPASG